MKDPNQAGTPNEAPANTNDSFVDEAPTTPRLEVVTAKKPKGFAALALKDRAYLSEIASKGGKQAHARGTAHEFTREEAKRAGALGGRATHAKRREAVAAYKRDGAA